MITKVQKLLFLGMILVTSISCLFLGCEKKAGTINVGAILPLTGNLALYGQNSKNAIELAISEIQTKNGPSINIFFEDDRAEAKDAVSAFQKLVSIDKISALIGPLPSGSLLAIAPIANQQHVVVISPGATSPDITDAGEFIFRNCPSDDYEGKEAAKFVYNKLGKSTSAVLYINNDYGVGVEKVFSLEFKKLGGEITASESFTQNETDFRSRLIKIQTTSPQVIYVVALNESIQIARQMKEMKLNAQILGSIMMNNQDIITKAQGALDGAVVAGWEFSMTNPDTKARDFISKFRSKYGNEPDVFAAHSYDALHIIAKTIEQLSIPFSPLEFQEELLKTSLDGVTGFTQFDENGDVVKNINFELIKNGSLVPYAEK